MTEKKKLIKRQATSQTNLSEAKAAELLQRLKNFLDRNIRKLTDDLRGGDVSAKEAFKVLGGIESALEDAGLKKELRELRAVFRDYYKVISEDFTDVSGKVALLGDAARESINAIVDDRLDIAARLVNRYVGDIRSVILDQVIAGKSVDYTQVLTDVGDGPMNNLKTEVNTGLMAFNRIVHAEKAKKAGMTKFLYVGPDDEITRPFCEEHIGQIYTADEIAELDNGQGLPVEIYGGGYNCRHHWRPVSDELAEEIEAEDTE